MTLVRLPLRGGEAFAESRLIEGAEVYFCAKDRCPHYQGQLGLIAEAATMYCALVHYAPDRTCQPYYLETAEHLDQNRRQTWQQRLDEAEAFEKALRTDSPSPGGGECVWERGPGGEGPGEAGLSSLGDDPVPSPGFQPGEEEAAPSTVHGLPATSAVASAADAASTAAKVLPFLPPSPAPRGRAGEGAQTQRRTTR